MTVGEKIKKARTLRGITQAELGKMIGLTGDRIRQYECDVRTPKANILNQLAYALNVSLESLSNTSVITNHDIIHTLFELESVRGLNIVEINGRHYLTFYDKEDPTKNGDLQDYLESWYTKKKELLSPENNTSGVIDNNIKEYEIWKMRFPMDEVQKNSDALAKLDKIRRLEAELAELKGE